MVEEEGDDGEGHAQPHSGGECDGGNAVDDPLGDQDVVFALDARLHGAHDGHGAHAEEDGGGDEALGEAGIPTSMDQLFPQHLAHGVQAVFDPQSLSQDGAQHHAHDDTQGVLRPHGGGDADTQDAQAQGVGEDGVKTRPDMVLEEHAQQAAQQDESGVDECGRHEKDSFPSTENVVLRYHTTGTLPL